MIKYGDLVQYIKDNHVSWNTDLFDVLRGFFDSYSQQYSPQPPLPPSSQSSQHVKIPPLQQELIFEHREFQAPVDGEYTANDLLNLFST